MINQEGLDVLGVTIEIFDQDDHYLNRVLIDIRLDRVDIVEAALCHRDLDPLRLLQLDVPLISYLSQLLIDLVSQVKATRGIDHRP